MIDVRNDKHNNKLDYIWSTMHQQHVTLEVK